MVDSEKKEIEITPEMIEAGRHHLYDLDLGHNDDRIISQVYVSMARAKRKASPGPAKAP